MFTPQVDYLKLAELQALLLVKRNTSGRKVGRLGNRHHEDNISNKSLPVNQLRRCRGHIWVTNIRKIKIYFESGKSHDAKNMGQIFPQNRVFVYCRKKGAFWTVSPVTNRSNRRNVHARAK
jgi:hypothetical protein